MPYSFANVTADLVPAPPGGATCSDGSSFNGHIGPIQTSSAGAFTMLLPANGTITPGSTQWKLTIQETGVPFPFGTGPQSFTYSFTASGSTQSLTSALSSAAPALTLAFGGSGTPSFASLTGGTNTTAAMVCGSGCTLSATGSGSITATSAAKWTTARLLAGNSVDGSAAVPFANKFIVQGTADSGLSGAQFLGALSTGVMKVTTTTGAITDSIYSDITALWTTGGTCNSTTTLFGDGHCAVPTGGVSGGTAGFLPLFGTATTITGSSHVDDGITTVGTITSSEPFVATSLTAGTAPAGLGVGAAGGWGCTEATSTGYTPTATLDYMRCDSTLHRFVESLNGGSEFPSSYTVASGATALGTSSIASGACASVVTVAATGVATTDIIDGVTPSADPTVVTGYAVSATGSLYIWAYPTSGNVNFKVCNNTSGALVPAALTVNWKVIR